MILTWTQRRHHVPSHPWRYSRRTALKQSRCCPSCLPVKLFSFLQPPPTLRGNLRAGILAGDCLMAHTLPSLNTLVHGKPSAWNALCSISPPLSLRDEQALSIFVNSNYSSKYPQCLAQYLVHRRYWDVFE